MTVLVAVAITDTPPASVTKTLLPSRVAATPKEASGIVVVTVFGRRVDYRHIASRDVRALPDRLHKAAVDDLEYRAIAIRSADICRTKEIPGGVGDQTGGREFSVGRR